MEHTLSDAETELTATAAEPGELEANESNCRPSMFGMFAWYASRILFGSLLVIGLAGWFVYQSAQKAPEFYQMAITISPDELASEGKEFESRVFDLQNSAHEQGQWQATFTEMQVNGWLGSDLPEKFPDVIPSQVELPRIAIENDAIKIAFKLNSHRFKGYVVAIGDAFCTDEPNQIAIRIKSAKSGIVPIPVEIWANLVTGALRKTGSSTTWTEIEGDPLALISLPEKLTDNKDRRVELQSIQLLDGKMVLSGVTIALDIKK